MKVMKEIRGKWIEQRNKNGNERTERRKPTNEWSEGNELINGAKERNEGNQRRNETKERGQEKNHKMFEMSVYMEQEEDVDSVDR